MVSWPKTVSVRSNSDTGARPAFGPQSVSRWPVVGIKWEALWLAASSCLTDGSCSKNCSTAINVDPNLASHSFSSICSFITRDFLKLNIIIAASCSSQELIKFIDPLENTACWPIFKFFTYLSEQSIIESFCSLHYKMKLSYIRVG